MKRITPKKQVEDSTLAMNLTLCDAECMITFDTDLVFPITITHGYLVHVRHQGCHQGIGRRGQ